MYVIMYCIIVIKSPYLAVDEEVCPEKADKEVSRCGYVQTAIMVISLNLSVTPDGRVTQPKWGGFVVRRLT